MEIFRFPLILVSIAVSSLIFSDVLEKVINLVTRAVDHIKDYEKYREKSFEYKRALDRIRWGLESNVSKEELLSSIDRACSKEY